MISTDRHLLNPQSAVAKRHEEYGTFAKEIHIVLFSLKKTHTTERVRLAPNVWVYPTASRSKWFYITDAYRIGKQILKDNQVTLISAQNPFETGIVGWLLTTGKMRLDFQLHTDPFSPYFTEGHGIMHSARVLMAKFLLPKAHAVRVVSKRIAEGIEKHIPKSPKPMVLPIYVDMKHFEEQQPAFDIHERYPQFKTIVLTLSRLEPEKNLMLAIDALKIVCDKHPDTGLVIVGSGSQKDELAACAKKLGLENNVVFFGWVDESDGKASVFKTADIFLLTSDFEGYALTLIEAAAAGRPIVTTDVGLVGDILISEEGALVCPPRNSACIAEKIARLIEDPTLGQNLVAAARRAIQERVLPNKQAYHDAYASIWNEG